MDIRQIRRTNMLSLIEREPSKAAFARKVETDPAYVSQILSAKTKADIGNALARAIESAYKLPNGWMDREHGTDGNDAIIDEFAWVYANATEQGRQLLLSTISAVRKAYVKEADSFQLPDKR